MERIDFPGNDLGFLSVTTIDDCAAACDANEKCVGFGSNLAFGTSCWLKSALANGSVASQRVTYRKGWNFGMILTS